MLGSNYNLSVASFCRIQRFIDLFSLAPLVLTLKYGFRIEKRIEGGRWA
jgi:hypothetical protein